MMDRFIGENGLPCSFEDSTWCRALFQAIASLDKEKGADRNKVTGFARLLWSVSEAGRDEELPRNRPASQAATDRELEKIIDLATRLADFIDDIHQPAVDSLFREGTLIFQEQMRLRQLAEYARHAYSENTKPLRMPKGAPTKIEAKIVAETCATIYREMTGKRPTFTTDPITGDISGAWPDFLQSAFDALAIDASVPSQVRRVSELMPRN